MIVNIPEWVLWVIGIPTALFLLFAMALGVLFIASFKGGFNK